MPIRLANERNGLSLLELMICVVIIGAIATYAMVRISLAKETAQEKACNHNVTQINSALERYAITNGDFPVDLTPLEANEYFPDGIPPCPVSGSAYSYNSTTHRVEGHNSGVHP